jgi:very-short-patch-repair endonuclease
MRKNQDLAKTLRKNQTDVEGFLWQFLRAKRLSGYKFRRQHPIGGYILDFYCPEKKLAIEVDGGQHGEDGQMVSDQTRTACLEKDGIRVLRFWDHDVMTNLDNILDDIIMELEKR